MRARFTATIRDASPRARVWRAVLGSNTVPIVEPTPHTASAPGIPSALFYRLDVSALNPIQFRRLTFHLARQFRVSRWEVERDIQGEHGCPILAEDVTVRVDERSVA